VKFFCDVFCFQYNQPSVPKNTARKTKMIPISDAKSSSDNFVFLFLRLCTFIPFGNRCRNQGYHCAGISGNLVEMSGNSAKDGEKAKSQGKVRQFVESSKLDC